MEKYLKVIGEAKGKVLSEFVSPYQNSAGKEQINTAKKNIANQFAALGVSEREINWNI